MAGSPNWGNVAQAYNDMAQAAQAIASEAQHLGNLQPVAQHALLQQILQAQQQMQQQMQQQAQQAQQQLQQQAQQLQQQLGTLEFNGCVRTLNSRVNPQEEVAWVRNAAGQLPQQAPMTLSDLQAATGPTIDPLLAHYGLGNQGTVPNRRARLLRHLGIPA